MIDQAKKRWLPLCRQDYLYFAMLVRLLCATTILLLLSPRIGAQKFAFHQYQTSQGLPSDEVRMVVQDHYGYIWLATDAGLLRFDGQQFQAYAQSIASQYIKAFCPAPDSSFYFTTDIGLYHLSPKRDSADIVQILPGNPQKTDSTLYYPNRLFLDSHDRLWISQPSAQLSLWTGDSLQHFQFPTDHASLYSDSDFHFIEDDYGSLWMICALGQVYHFSEQDRQFVAHPRLQISGRIYDLTLVDNQMYLAGEGLWKVDIVGEGKLSGLRKYDSQGKVFQSIYYRPKQKNFLLGSSTGGLFQAKIEGRELLLQTVFGANDPHRVDELPFRCIHDIFVDEKEEIWLSTAQGLGLLESPFFEGVFALVNNNTFSICPSPDGVYLSFGDLYHIQAEGEEFFGNLVPNLESYFINAIAVKPSGLWLSTTTGELIEYHQGQVKTLIDLSQRGAGVFYLTADQNDNLWFCQSPQTSPITGIAKLNSKNEIIYYEEDKGLESRMLVVKESPRGRIYAAGIGSDSYLYRYRPEEDDFINMSLPLPFRASENFEVHDMAIDEQGVIWLGSTDGLLRFDLEHIELVELGPYTNTEVRAVCSNGQGGVWLATDTDGILYYQDGQHVIFNENSGLPSKIAAYRCLAIDDEGRIWAGTAEGVVYSSETVPQPNPTPQPIIRFLKANGKDTNLDSLALNLPHQSMITTDFVTLDFPGNQLAYRYRLLGHPDSSWQEKDIESSLSIGPLSKGKYSLQIQARQAGGYYWSPALEQLIIVRPIWYQTWWGMGLLLLVFLGIMILLFRLNGLRLLRKIARLEGKLAAQNVQFQDGAPKQVELATIPTVTDSRHLNMLQSYQDGLSFNPSWEEVITHLKSALENIPHLDAFVFGYYQSEMLHLRGYNFRTNKALTQVEPFEENASSEVWVLVNRKAMWTGDGKGAYPSKILIPFEVHGIQHLVLGWYNQQANRFFEADFLTVQILADQLSFRMKRSLADE